MVELEVEPMPDPDEPFLDSQGKPRSKSYLEKKKLDLEITNLEKKNKWEMILAFVPLCTVLLSVIGLAVGFWQFKRQQDKWLEDQKDQRTAQEQERTAQSLKQLRSNVDEISKFTQDESQTSSRVVFLLDDMKTLIRSRSTDPAQLPEAFASYEKIVTKTLVEQIVNDADFQKSSRHVMFAAKVVTSWPDYKQHLQKEEQVVTLNRILSNYTRAIGNFRNKNSSYLANVFYNKIAKRYNTPEGYEPNLFRDLSYIVQGFKEHVDLISNKPEEKKRFIVEFEQFLCHENIGEEMLGNAFIANVGCKKQ